MTDFDTGLPSVRFVQKMIKDKTPVEIKTLANEVFVGTVLWQDSQCICLQGSDNRQCLLWKQAMMYLREPK
jgi:host factor-I protein